MVATVEVPTGREPGALAAQPSLRAHQEVHAQPHQSGQCRGIVERVILQDTKAVQELAYQLWILMQ